MIRYVDTRGSLSEPLAFTDVVLQGIASGGGLFVPERIPGLSPDRLESLSDLAYWQCAAEVFKALELDIPEERIDAIAREAYGSNFDHRDVAVLRDLGVDRFVLELWHGPTLAFKDMALQCMPLFFSEAVEQSRRDGRADADYLILVATSGDTGAAALSGFSDREHTKIAVCYPEGGVSSLQQRQMTTQAGSNLTVLAVEGDFDACQSCVKAVFADEEFQADLLERHRLRLSSANSINWGRLLPQIVYYVVAYVQMIKRGRIRMGDPIDVCVPSGNFGNLLAAYYAKRMGIPIDRLLCASNVNNVLSDFLSDGRYDISQRTLVKTASPSMDILISSNLERLLYELTGNGEQVSAWMKELVDKGAFALDEVTFARVRREFIGDFVDDAVSLATIGRVQREHRYLMDPHSAVAWEVAERHMGDHPMLVVSTAHWSKFPADVVRGLSGLAPGDEVAGDEGDLLAQVDNLAPGHPVPDSIRQVCARPVRFTGRVQSDPDSLEQGISEWLGQA